MDTTKPNFRRIGRGFCGSVWAVDRVGNSCAMKRGDGGPGRSVRKDYDFHLRALASLASIHQLSPSDYEEHSSSSQPTPHIQIPHCHSLIPSEDKDWWNRRLQRFPKTHSPCDILITERIQPLSQPVRQLFIDKFCSKATTRPNPRFSLRNYPLHIDQMEEIGGLDTRAYARTMGEALATMHWSANIDANDVEFANTFSLTTLGEHSIWMLDFDCCNTMTMDEAGVEQAVAAFFRNDPFYPRPGSDYPHDKILWDEFRTQYLETSAILLANYNSLQRLPDFSEGEMEETKAML
ncbi:hypothetical protein EJ08DRAFT_670603 [Tothia fuscella]|uniref:DUF3669 domain-containing protein n=1 Tax=Tothia fuscella TaxID=1048955 RepID=A0A9P4TYV8_9PEZI|nr:hypothetical protein EJ08DRAFT_670603 [Tothia fuscella]